MKRGNRQRLSGADRGRCPQYERQKPQKREGADKKRGEESRREAEKERAKTDWLWMRMRGVKSGHAAAQQTQKRKAEFIMAWLLRQSNHRI